MRMPALSAAALATLSLACGPAKTEIEGNAFVTEPSGAVRRLAGMPVQVFDRKDLVRRIATRVASVEKEAPRLDAARADLERRLREKTAEVQGRMDRREPASGEAFVRLEREVQEMKAEAARMVAAAAGYRSGAAFVAGLEGGSATAKTDANGRFVLTVPARTPLILVAILAGEPPAPSRYWVVPIDTRDARAQVVLSNENEVRSAEELAGRIKDRQK